jgi:hypothetical protein
MELPHDWGSTKRAPQTPQPQEDPQAKKPPPPQDPKKRKAAVAEEPPPPKQVKVPKCPLGPRSVFNAVTHDAPEKGQLKQMVVAQLSKPPAASDKEDAPTLEVHCLLSKLPYQKMLSDLFMHQDKEVLPSPHIPYVTKAYEESFMREPMHSNERLCAKNELCECMFIDKENPFTAVEFLLPGEKPPPTPHLCVVCSRQVCALLISARLGH